MLFGRAEQNWVYRQPHWLYCTCLQVGEVSGARHALWAWLQMSLAVAHMQHWAASPDQVHHIPLDNFGSTASVSSFVWRLPASKDFAAEGHRSEASAISCTVQLFSMHFWQPCLSLPAQGTQNGCMCTLCLGCRRPGNCDAGGYAVLRAARKAAGRAALPAPGCDRPLPGQPWVPVGHQVQAVRNDTSSSRSTSRGLTALIN